MDELEKRAKDFENKLKKSKNIRADIEFALDNYDVEEPMMKEILLKHTEILREIKLSTTE